MANPGATFHALVVCTANQFRSPFAQLLLAHRATQRGLAWSITSAGMAATPGRPLDDRIARLLGERGVPPAAEWRSTRLDAGLVRAADVVLVAEQKHRRAVVELEPAALGHTFLLAHFARLLDAADVDRFADGPHLLAAARAQRGRMQPVPAENDEIPDPAGRSARRLRACTARIAEVVDLLVGETGS